MYKIGITGGIGSGKSTVCELLAGYGVAVYDSDARAKALMAEDKALRERLIAAFGEECYTEQLTTLVHVVHNGIFQILQRNLQLLAGIDSVSKQIDTLTLDNAGDTHTLTINIHQNGEVGGVGVLQLEDIPQYKRGAQQTYEYWRYGTLKTQPQKLNGSN